MIVARKRMVLLSLCWALLGADSPQPQLLPGALLHDGVLSGAGSETLEEKSEAGTVTARDLVVHESADKCLQTGVYETGANRYRIDEPYPHDELMYFLSGGVSLRSTDGTLTEVAAGDGVMLPRGWTGLWDSQGYRKLYVIYGCPK